MNTRLDPELTEAFEALSPPRRGQVLDYARWLRDADGGDPNGGPSAADVDLDTALLALDPVQRQRVAEYVCALAANPSRGVPGHALLRFAGTLPETTLRRMEQVIEDECERIDHGGW